MLEEMKTLTIDETTYEVVDGKARAEISAINEVFPEIYEKEYSTNLIYFNNTSERTENGVTISVDDDGLLCLNGTCTSDMRISISGCSGTSNDSATTFHSGSYIFHRELMNGETSGSTPALFYYGNDGNAVKVIEDSKLVVYREPVFHVRISKGDSFNNAKFGLMLEKGDTSHPYSKYGILLRTTAVDKKCRDNVSELFKTYSEQIPEIENSVNRLSGLVKPKTAKVLGIGNSFTHDSMRWLCAILKNAGYSNVIVGYGMIGGIMLSEQYYKLMNNAADYDYFKYDNSKNAIIKSGRTLGSILTDESWDVVVFQQQSDESGQFTSFLNDNFNISDFANEVKNMIGNPNLKIGLNATWAHRPEYNGAKFINYYGRDSEVMHSAVQAIIPRVAAHIGDCDFVVNTGMAVKLARNNDFLFTIGNALSRDGTHMDYGIGRFMCAFCYAHVIFGVQPNEVTFYPTPNDDALVTEPSNKFLAFVAKQCAVNGQLVN